MNNVKQFILERFVYRIRQYGVLAAIVQLSKAAIRRFYHENRDLVFIIADFQGFSFSDPCISSLTRERVEKGLSAGELGHDQAELLLGFFDAGCLGICAEVGGKLAGYAWVQLAGEYSFGRTGRMILPPKYALFKYLFVFSEYRGMRLGQKLNAARLALVPNGYTPVVFIIPDNRYAIRNWERLGFQRVIAVKRWQWWRNGSWRMRTTKLVDLPEATPLMHALLDSGDV